MFDGYFRQRAAACALLVGAGAPLEARGGAAALTPLLLAAKNQVCLAML